MHVQQSTGHGLCGQNPCSGWSLGSDVGLYLGLDLFPGQAVVQVEIQLLCMPCNILLCMYSKALGMSRAVTAW